MRSITRFVAGLTLAASITAGCSTSEPTTSAAPSDASESVIAGTTAPGIRLVSAADGAELQANPPTDLVILDVRTPEEFAEGHLEGAIMIDFYRGDFAEQLAALDPDVPYLLYCRSGNRSGQTATIMAGLGFSDVADIDGGIVSWTQSGLPTITP